MLSLSKTDLKTVLPIFSSRGVDVTFLVPTPTGLDKSIMDAIAPLREFLARTGLHDYQSQAQGPDAKVELPAAFVLPDRTVETTASMYRPTTKMGDPRIWFRGLKERAEAFDLLGIATDGEMLYVFDLSDAQLVESLRHGGTPGANVLARIARSSSRVSEELLKKLVEVSRLGFVETTVRGDTGVGMTLERLLDIAPNSSKAPDYQGIEIKAARRSKTMNRVNLFSQVPNWGLSALSTAQRLLDEYGYEREGRRQLYCTVDAVKPNPQGLYFVVDEAAGRLLSKAVQGGVAKDVVQWETGILRTRLLDKHGETFWVKAHARRVDGVEQFHYAEIVHTRKPSAFLLEALIASGVVTMDFTLSQKPNCVRDHGYLFKIRPENVGLLFPEPIHYDLTAF